MPDNKKITPAGGTARAASLSLEVIPAFAVIIDTSFNILDSNSLWEKFLKENALVRGSSIGSSIGRNYLKILQKLNGDIINDIKNGLTGLSAGDIENYTVECHIMLNSGNKWFNFAASDAGGDNGFLILHSDISSYKSNEELLKKYEGRQKSYLLDISRLKEDQHNLKIRNDEISIIYEATRAIGTSLNLKKVYSNLYTVLKRSMRCDNMLVSSYSEKDKTISCIHGIIGGKEMDISAFPSIPLAPDGGGTQSTVIRTGKPLLINNYSEQVKKHTVKYYLENTGAIDNKPFHEQNLPLSAMLVPLIFENKVIGLIQLQSYEYESYGDIELKFLEALAPQIAVATANAKLYEQVNTELNERIKVEEHLRKSEEKFRRLVNNISDALIVDDTEGNIIFANEQFVKLYKLEGKDITRLNIKDYVAPEWKDKLVERHRKRIKGEKVPAYFEYEALKSDGTKMWVEVSVVTVTEKDGAITGTQSVIRDVSEKKNAEEKQRKLQNEKNELLERLQLQLERMPIACMICDKDHVITYFNPSAEKIFGFKKEEVVGKRPDESIVPPEKGEYIEGLFEKLKKNEELGTIEAINLTKSGKKIILEWVNTPLHKSDGTFIGIMSMAQDITERKLSQEALERRNQIISRLNEAGKEFGKSLTLNKVYDTVYHVIKNLMACDSLIISSFNADEELITCEFVVLDDEKIDVSKLPPIAIKSAGDGTQSHSINTGESLLIRDYNEHLMQSRTNYFMKPDGRVEKSAGDAEAIPRSALVVPLKLENRVIGVIQVHSYRVNTFDEDDLHILEALSPQVSAATANAILYEQAKSEIRQRRKAEMEIRMLNEELEERVRERTAQLESANKELESFSYTVSHDLRAPLRAIDGFSQILEAELGSNVSAESKRLLDVISKNTRKMGQLIDDLLDFSRLNKKIVSHSTVNMQELVTSVAEELKNHEKTRNIRINISPLESVKCDAAMVRQVWINLISNSLKFTSTRETAQIDIGCENTENEIIFHIKDNGVGFNMKYSSKLFKVFERLHNEKDFEGTGVGLAIVYRIIAKHGGKVWAEGIQNEGASFFIALPRKAKLKG